jgi:hypothetical protein
MNSKMKCEMVVLTRREKADVAVIEIEIETAHH